jgi:phage virion morphogenesis protein
MAITVDSRELQEALKRLAESVENLREPLDQIGAAVSNNAQLRFPAQAGPGGKPWSKLSPVTLARRKKGGKGAQALLDTGRLRASITHNVHSNTVEVGTNVEYAAVQQFGATRGAFGRTKRGAPIPWGNIPARPFLGLDAEDIADLGDIISKYLKK